MKTLRRWTNEEDKLLNDNYKKYGPKAFHTIPDRTPAACRGRAHKLRLYNMPKWTKEDDEILRKFYPIIGENVCNKMNNRHTMNACYARACILGISRYKQ